MKLNPDKVYIRNFVTGKATQVNEIRRYVSSAPRVCFNGGSLRVSEATFIWTPALAELMRAMRGLV